MGQTHAYDTSNWGAMHTHQQCYMGPYTYSVSSPVMLKFLNCQHKSRKRIPEALQDYMHPKHSERFCALPSAQSVSKLHRMTIGDTGDSSYVEKLLQCQFLGEGITSGAPTRITSLSKQNWPKFRPVSHLAAEPTVF